MISRSEFSQNSGQMQSHQSLEVSDLMAGDPLMPSGTTFAHMALLHIFGANSEASTMDTGLFSGYSRRMERMERLYTVE